MKTKAELRAELAMATQQFQQSGGRITRCEPQEVKTRLRCTGRQTRNKMLGGVAPTGLKSQFAKFAA